MASSAMGAGAVHPQGCPRLAYRSRLVREHEGRGGPANIQVLAGLAPAPGNDAVAPEDRGDAYGHVDEEDEAPAQVLGDQPRVGPRPSPTAMLMA